MKTTQLFITSILFSLSFTSCLKNDIVEPVLIIDPPIYANSANWKEIAIKEGDNDWVSIPKGDTLKMMWNNLTNNFIGGIYSYNGNHLMVQQNGYFTQDDKFLAIIKLDDSHKQDTLNLVGFSKNESSDVMIINNLANRLDISVQLQKIK